MLRLANQVSSEADVTADADTWALLVDRHHQMVGAVACCEYLKGLRTLSPFAQSLAKLEVLNARLAPRTRWEMTLASGMTDDTFFFREIVRHRFPVAVEIRSRDELGFAALPDMFHDVYGHVPYLLTRRGALAHRMFGEVARRGGFEPTLVQRLSTLFWFTFEVGLVREDDAVKALGAAILTSSKEIRNIQREECRIEPFDLGRVLETYYQPRALQPRYFLLSSFSEIFAALKQLVPRRSAPA
jgi:phenylalanine-4-hydroxylase